MEGDEMGRGRGSEGGGGGGGGGRGGYFLPAEDEEMMKKFEEKMAVFENDAAPLSPPMDRVQRLTLHFQVSDGRRGITGIDR